MPKPSEPTRLAQALRDLRKGNWADVKLTQYQLAKVFSVAGSTISAWESPSNADFPSEARINAYARFFSTRRSLDGALHLLPEDDLTADEHDTFQTLQQELLNLLHGGSDHTDASDNSSNEEDVSARQSTFLFSTGPIIVVFPNTPADTQGSLAKKEDPNFDPLQQGADLRALVEIIRHISRTNPNLDVDFRLAKDVESSDLSSHLILLGGVAWNSVTNRIQDVIKKVLPIKQIEVDDLETGEIFEVEVGGKAKRFAPVFRGDGSKREHMEDVALLARLPNPYKMDRTLTICNGVHGRGVYGAVRCLTDPNVRDATEQYLAERFPDGRFALVLRVPVVANEVISPDVQNPEVRLFEWPVQESALK